MDVIGGGDAHIMYSTYTQERRVHRGMSTNPANLFLKLQKVIWYINKRI